MRSSRRPRLRDVLRACGWGEELVERGWPQDLDAAAELDVSACGPRLADGAYVRVP